MRSYAASWRDTFWKVKLPAATPSIFTGLRTAAGLSVIGAIVAELPVGSSTGIGRIIYDAAQYYLFDPSALWASTLAAFALGASFFLAVVVVEALISKRLGGFGAP
jgi:NitT/TauT family transport system permease protein